MVEKIFKTNFKEFEVINYCQSGTVTADQVFAQLQKDNKNMTTLFRWVTWIMSVIGHAFLFYPIIKVFAWIPLVGKLLAAILTFAFVIFAFIWASTLHLFILSLSWLVYRPLYGLLLLTGVAIGLGVMCIGEKSKYTGVHN